MSATPDRGLVRPGRLLVANPLLPDANFDRTVVMLLASGEEGALGLVLNRPSEMQVASPLPQWEHLATDPAVVFLGGPVQRQAVICLARVAAAGGSPAGEWDGPGAEVWMPVLPDVGTLDLDSDPDEAGPRIRRLRLFAGYAGWAAGQLEAEIDAGAWWVVDAEPDDAFSDAPDDLWKRVLRRQRGRLKLVSWYPEDPRWN